MQKLYGLALVAAATISLSGCSLLGGTSDDTSPVVPEQAPQRVMQQQDVVAPQPAETVTPTDTSGQQLPVAQPDPVAEQKAMQETQDDAPTGVQTQ